MIIGLEYVITWEGFHEPFIGKLTSITDSSFIFEGETGTGIVLKSSVESGATRVRLLVDISA